MSATPARDATGLPQSDSFVFVKIPLRRHEVDPLHRREEQIDEALRNLAIGTVIGWGDSLGERDPQGRRRAAYIRIDITTRDPDAVREALHTLLPSLGASVGTEIHYTDGQAQQYMDLARDQGWTLAQRMTEPKPPVRHGF
jgi:hypothetical protein